MMCYSKLEMTVILLVLMCVSIGVRGHDRDGSFEQCEHIVQEWELSSLDTEVESDRHELRDLLFFLHIPRTGGRTYLHCFLKKLYSNSQECPRSYDKLRFNPRKPNCRLLSTHDDYSMISKLPKEKTSVVTILRNPIDRVFSSYEFSVEVAARFLIHPNLTSVARMVKRPRSKMSGVSTLDIWPWKYLVPWMREDLFARRDARKLTGQLSLGTNNPYNMKDVLMPLHEYINHPIAKDVIHNGATFQIAGLTNNSYFAKSHDIRHCVLKYQTLGKHVLKVAKKRLDGMLYVGLTENHRESANMFANVVGSQVISQHLKSNPTIDVSDSDDSEQSSLLPDAKRDANNQDSYPAQNLNNISSIQKDKAANENLTVGKLMKTYETCIATLRSTQAERRVNSLKQISPANITKEARRMVPEALIQKIMSLNSLDAELYKYAEHIFAKQQAHMMQNTVDTEKAENSITYSWIEVYDPSPWRFVSLIGMSGLSLLIFIFIYLNAKRTSKIKL